MGLKWERVHKKPPTSRSVGECALVWRGEDLPGIVLDGPNGAFTTGKVEDDGYGLLPLHKVSKIGGARDPDGKLR